MADSIIQLDGTQNDLTKKESENMENEIKSLMAEVEIYKQAIEDAKDALASAERELDDALQTEYEKQQ